MKIFYCIRSLDGIPSCIYNIQFLNELGYEVIPILGSASTPLVSVLEGDRVEYELLNNSKESPNTGSIFRRFIMNYRYRTLVQKTIKNKACKDDIVFLGTGDTIISLYGILMDYKRILVLKELYDSPRYYQTILRRAAKNAAGIVCCEKNRSRIIKSRWHLCSLPYTIPNKPAAHPRIRKMEPSCEITSTIIENIKDRKIILYQARHIHFVSELEKLARALKSINGDYLLVLVGTIDNAAEIAKVIDIYPQTYMTGHIPSPKHMEITSYAYIGVAVYQEDSLNNLFCAPNKIYEYAGFGIPTLGNDIPGLVSTIGLNGAGECVLWQNTNDIKQAIERIECNYADCARNAIVFFEKTDCKRILHDIVEDTTKRELFD